MIDEYAEFESTGFKRRRSLFLCPVCKSDSLMESEHVYKEERMADIMKEHQVTFECRVCGISHNFETNDQLLRWLTKYSTLGLGPGKKKIS